MVNDPALSTDKALLQLYAGRAGMMLGNCMLVMTDTC